MDDYACPLCGCTQDNACEDCNDWVVCSECHQQVCDGKKCAVQSPYGGKWICQPCNQKKVKEVVDMDNKNRAYHGLLPLNTFDEDSRTGDDKIDKE